MLEKKVFERPYRFTIVFVLATRAIKALVLRSHRSVIIFVLAIRAIKALVLAIETYTIVVRLSKSSIVTIATLRVNILSPLAITEARVIVIRISLRKSLTVEAFLIKTYKASRNRLIYYINKTSNLRRLYIS